MSDKGSVFSKGGGGTNFEQYVQTAFLVTMMIRGNVPCIPSGEISEICFQTTRSGYQTDDLLVIAKSNIEQHRLLVQSKYNLTFSSDNEEFKKVIKAFWEDFNNTRLFDKTKDRLIITKSGLNDIERNHIKGILNWAKSKSSASDFLKEIKRIQIKQKKLDIFTEALKETNNGKALSDNEIWEFLKCLELLEYDFLNHGSVDEAYFLNLIKLSKSNSVAVNEKEIWDSVYAFAGKRNKDGGSFSIESIQKEDIYKYFNYEKLNPIYNSIEKLRSDSELILKPLKNTIKNFHLERYNLMEDIVVSMNTYPFTVITGKPGVGKSAIVKDALKANFQGSSVFVFRADQFNEPHLSHVFSNLGIYKSIKDIFSCISLIPEKIILIDSLEKLLEGDPDNAFKQLLSAITSIGNVKIITTCRKYAIELLIQKFGLENINKVDIPHLNNDELKEVTQVFPKLLPLFNNEKICDIIRITKYLDFTLPLLDKKDEDFSTITLTDLKDKLWNHIVEDIETRKNGLPAKRGKTFLNIALQRAKKMSLFVKPVDVDAEAVDCLEHDGVIFQEKDNRKYAPSHDILEDWALVKFIAKQRDKFSSSKDFFSNLGNEPAIRRAFRLWVEDSLTNNEEKILNLIKEALSDKNLERYWADELLIAIFKSEVSHKFFKEFKGDLLKKEGALLNRCLHLIKTACKESNMTGIKNFELLSPIGSGWGEVIHFIHRNLNQLDSHRLIILKLLLDWKYKLYNLDTEFPIEAKYVKDISLHFIKEIEDGNEFWKADNIRKEIDKLIVLLFTIAKIAKNDVQKLIRRALIRKESQINCKLREFYEKIINFCLSGLYSLDLARELPDLLIEVANNEWKLKEGEVKHSSYPKINRYFGLKPSINDSPAGIYKTPVYNLLRENPYKALKFTVELINYCTLKYIESNFSKNDNPIEIEITKNDGSKIKQWGTLALWLEYRGTEDITPYLLQSILMSLEKFLLEVVESKEGYSKNNFKLFFRYLLSNSKSVAITSVLASVAMAYPEEVEEEMLPIFSVKEFYEWDLKRSLVEYLSMAPIDNKIPFAQKERYESNQLPHRKKYKRGLRDFIVDYQFKIGKYNKKIYGIFDKLQSEVSPGDMVWKKALNEMDIRKPKYEDYVKEFINSNQHEFEAYNKTSNISHLIECGYEKKDGIEFTFQKWQECYNHLIVPENLNYSYDRPVTLAITGLRDFHDKLTLPQKKWCLETIVNSIISILQNTYYRGRNLLSTKYNIMEEQLVLKSFSLLFDNEEAERREELLILLICTLIAPFFGVKLERMINSIRNDVFKNYPEIAQRAWVILIKYSQFKKANPYFNDVCETQIPVKKKEKEFIYSIVKEKNFELKIEEINLDKYETWCLIRAFTVIPYDTNNPLYINFIKQFLNLLITDLQQNDDYFYRSEERNIEFEGIMAIEKYLSDFLLQNNLQLTILDILLDTIYNLKQGQYYKDLLNFVEKTLERLIYKLDDIITNETDEEKNRKVIENFWNLWYHLFLKIKESKKSYFSSVILLDIQWNKEADHWKPLENKKKFYRQISGELGNKNVSSIVNVLSTIGDKCLLPDGITWLVEILKDNKDQRSYLFSESGERLIQRLYHRHMNIIKNDTQLINDFIWLLNIMVDMGSSQAYLIRENVITYKKI